MSEKPEIDFTDGPPPNELVIEASSKVPCGRGCLGHSRSALCGRRLQHGWQFDASWDRGESIVFPLSGTIAGWQEGIPGMKVGGRRQLIIPRSLLTVPPELDTDCPAPHWFS